MPQKTFSIKVGYLTVLILISTFELFSQQHFNLLNQNYSYDLTLSMKIKASKQGQIKQLVTQFYFIPKNDVRQKVNSIEYSSTPNADSIDIKRSRFIWRKLHDQYEFCYKANINTDFYQYPIKHSPFPFPSINDSLKKYVLFDAIINQTDQIQKQALSLVKNERQLFSAVFNIAYWIHKNIKYVHTGMMNIETASVVFNSKFGDCDEISVIFISMLRSVGIPCRLVSGIAKGRSDFEFHAWIEVFFGETGWVPFDATFAQFGYIDQSHLKLKHDHTITSILSTDWVYYPFWGEVDFESQPFPNILVQGTSHIPIHDSPFEIKVFAYKNKINNNSYLPIVISTRNKTPYFASNKLFINKIKEIEILGETEYIFEYSPYEIKETKVLLKLKDVNSDFIEYTSQLITFDHFGEMDSTTICFIEGVQKISYEKAVTILDTLSGKIPIRPTVIDTIE